MQFCLASLSRHQAQHVLEKWRGVFHFLGVEHLHVNWVQSVHSPLISVFIVDLWLFTCTLSIINFLAQMVPALIWELPLGSCVSALSPLLLCVCLLVSAFPHFPALQESSHFLSLFPGEPSLPGVLFPFMQESL